jgi:signal transduction histidine kinase
MRFTVARKITVGVVLILLIGAGSMIFIYQGLDSVKTAMDELAQIKEPTSAAAYEMEIQLHGIAAAVLRYLDTGDSKARSDAETNAAKFQKFHDEYLRLSGTEQGREAGRALNIRHEQFKALGESLMAKKDKLEALHVAIAENFEKLDEIIDDHLEPLTTGTSARLDPVSGGTKAEAVLDIEADVAEVGLWLANYERVRKAEYKDRMFNEEKEVRKTLSRLKAFDLSKEELRWTAVLEKLFNQTMSLIRHMLAADDEVRERAREFLRQAAEIDRILDERVQILARQDLLAPTKAADEATIAVINRTRILIPLFLLSAIVVALLLVRVMTRPLKELKRGTEAIARGNLRYRVQRTGRDEFADVANDFNRMVEQLEATTVSKGLLEARELELKETVSRLRQEIAERMSAQEEQARLQASLRRAETMSAMGSLVAGVAHEVRNPLFGISSVLDAMDARLGARGEYQRYTAVLRLQVERLTGLMQDLLEYGRPPNLELARRSIGDAIGEAIHACGPLAQQAGVQITPHLQVGAAPVMMDNTRVAQVFENLLENAIHHSAPGSTVTVEARQVSENARAWIECAVKDSGPGISPEDIPRIFEPFFTRRRGGTGLGLSIVQRIIEQHGGEISVNNRPEGGAVVAVRFPFAEQ